MSEALWDSLRPSLATELNRTYIKKIGGAAVPGDFLVLRAEGVGRGPTLPGPDNEIVGCYINKNASNPSQAVINIL